MKIKKKKFRRKEYERYFKSTSSNLLSSKKYMEQKMKFFIKDFFSKCDQIYRMLNGKLHFLCSEIYETK